MFTIIILATLIHDSDQSVSKLRRKLIKKSYKRVLEGADVGVCGLTWWKKPGKTTDLGWATTTLPHVYTRVDEHPYLSRA